MRILDEIRDLIFEIQDTDRVKEAVEEALGLGVDSLQILDSLNEALDEVGRRYESGEYFLSELIMTGMMATEVTSMLKPYLAKVGKSSLGRILFGTVKGDIHDIGKNIVIMMLGAAGFEICDLGVDVSANRFADRIMEEKVDILAMSALLTSTMNEIKNVIQVIEERGLREQVKIIVGGRPVTREFAKEIGADGYAKDAVEAIKVCKNLLENAWRNKL